MELYLRECKEYLKNLPSDAKILIVLGNEACDLDSAVSSIVLAYLKKKTIKSYSAVLPVLNTLRKDLKIHSEVVYFLEEAGISLEDLICKDELNIKKFASDGILDVALVDHNVLSVDDSYLEPYILSVIDHHAISNSSFLKHGSSKIESVGSCCTLVAEEIFSMEPSLLDPQIAMLLYGTILLDTVCLCNDAGRVTEKDKVIVERLENVLEGIGREEVFHALQKAKFDTTGYSPEQLLQKDLKIASSNSHHIAISSMSILLEALLNDGSFENVLKKFITEKNAIALIMMGSQLSKEKKSLRRQIGVFSLNSPLLLKLSAFLKSLQNPCLELKDLSVSTSSFIVFEQQNVTLTRKFVFPSVQQFLAQDLSGCINFCNDDSENLRLENIYLNEQDASNEIDIPSSPLFSYKAEPLDFPESPKHTNLHKISLSANDSKVYTQNFDSVSTTLDELGDSEKTEYADEIEESTLPSLRLRKIPVHPNILHSDGIEDDQKSISSLSNKSDIDVFSPIDDVILPDDDTPEIENSEGLDSSVSEPIPEISAAEEFEEERSWRSCFVGGEERTIDMKVIEPYKKVISHGGYHGPTKNAIIIFSACYLPNRCRQDYTYVMDNLFLYVLTTLDQLITDDYILVYLHGATERGSMPSFNWLKRCYQMIDRKLRKNLKGLYLVHPTFWLKTIVIMTRPFISTKFSRKLKFVESLDELSSLIPLGEVCIPQKVKKFDEEYYKDS